MEKEVDVDVDGGCASGYIGLLWNVLGILLSGDMVSLEKIPCFP